MNDSSRSSSTPDSIRPQRPKDPRPAVGEEEPTQLRDFMPRNRFISRILFTVLVFALLWIAYAALPAFILFFAAAVLAVVFHGCSRLLGRILPGGRKVTLTATILIFVGLFGASILLLMPKAIHQFNDLLQAASSAYERFAATEFGNAVIDSASDDDNGNDGAFSLDAAMLGRAAGWATNAVRAVTSVSIVFVLAIFIAASPESLHAGFVSLFPVSLRPRASEIFSATYRSLWNWTIGQGFSMLVIAILSIVIYTSIGLNFALTLGLLAGLFQFIPYLGPALSAVPAMIVAFSMSNKMALLALLAYIVIQTVEGNLITPLIMKHKAYLPPVLAIMATVIFGLLFGLAGAALATPLVIVALTLYREVYQKDILEAPVEARAH